MKISCGLSLPRHEIELTAIGAQGPGGQNVNKVATAIRLRFDIPASSLPEELKQRLLNSSDSRIGRDGVLVFKAQRYRSQEKNRADALLRLRELIARHARPVKARKATRPGRAAVAKRLEQKVRRGQVKRLRGKVSD